MPQVSFVYSLDKHVFHLTKNIHVIDFLFSWSRLVANFQRNKLGCCGRWNTVSITHKISESKLIFKTFRVLAADRNINLDVYTGTWGIIELKDISGVPQPYYLSIIGATKKIPVPKLYYRIVINKADDSGVVVIGVNNPHLTLEEIKKDYVVCTDVSSQIKYISWQKEIVSKGYTYACAVNDFVKVVPHIQVSASKLLV